MINNSYGSRSPIVQILAHWHRFVLVLPALLTVLLLAVQPLRAENITAMNDQNAGVSQQDWAAYSAHFISKDGRVIDDANGNISHSEGQGYGLLLAFMAGQKADFELIWSFTQTEMLIRNDGLSVWKWDPATRPHITDTNNASDGDLLISYALALAGKYWDNPDYRSKAAMIAGTLLKKQVVMHEGETILLPAMRGFAATEREDGPVINLSYWVFEAFPLLNELVPSDQWAALSASGLKLLQNSRFGAAHLPSDWISLHQAPHPASGFAPEFGYNNLRIALYLARAGFAGQQLSRQIAAAMADQQGQVTLVNVESDQTTSILREAGYRIIPQLTACINDKAKLSADVIDFVPTQYYPSTLQLLALAYAKQHYAECL